MTLTTDRRRPLPALPRFLSVPVAPTSTAREINVHRAHQNVDGRLAVKRLRVLTTRCGSGKRSLGVKSCLMLARRTSDVFSISATRMICGDLAPARALRAADLDRTEAGAVSRRHVLVDSVDSVGAGELAELLVHVVAERVSSLPTAGQTHVPLRLS